jgi:protein-S-isoprenylcysteine O-methyltransferase Ste14
MVIGLLLIFIGLLIRIIAMRTLKRCFSLQLNSQLNIITTGIYKYIRHPSYIGTLLIILGLSIIYIPLAVIYLAFIFFLSRAINEEQILSSNIDYIEYQKKTGMFIPKFNKKKEN